MAVLHLHMALTICLAALCLGPSISPRLTAAADTYNRCGTDYGDAVDRCDACPGGVDDECGTGKKCFKAASYPACSDGSGVSFRCLSLVSSTIIIAKCCQRRCSS